MDTYKIQERSILQIQICHEYIIQHKDHIHASRMKFLQVQHYDLHIAIPEPAPFSPSLFIYMFKYTIRDFYNLNVGYWR